MFATLQSRKTTSTGVLNKPSRLLPAFPLIMLEDIGTRRVRIEAGLGGKYFPTFPRCSDSQPPVSCSSNVNKTTQGYITLSKGIGCSFFLPSGAKLEYIERNLFDNCVACVPCWVSKMKLIVLCIGLESQVYQMFSAQLYESNKIKTKISFTTLSRDVMEGL